MPKEPPSEIPDTEATGSFAPKKRRGFAAMDPKLLKRISSSGGRAAHQAGTAHQFTHEEAVAAGKKGGRALHVSRGKARGLHVPPVPEPLVTLPAEGEEGK